MKTLVYGCFACVFCLMVLMGQSPEVMDWLGNHVIDYWAHYLIYSWFGIMLTSIFYLERWWVWWALPLGALIATLEELRQYFLPHRSVELSDLVANFWGIGTGFTLVYLLVFLIHRRAPGIKNDDWY